MKRRNAENGKMRRPIKRTKITEGMYGNSMLYLKLVLLWASIVVADYMLEFRFEFLWPFWMMLRSVHDSFKYQGFAFSVFFICIALTSDMICYFFIPVQWVFVAASAYVWVQYIWYTDRGICMPTVALCVLLVYIEAVVRGVKETTKLYTPGQLELCRPFAAHCVGYPVVTFGFGIKSYVTHRLRLRKQREVQSINKFYVQLLRHALPEVIEEQESQSKEAEVKNVTTALTNGHANIDCPSAQTTSHTVQNVNIVVKNSKKQVSVIEEHPKSHKGGHLHNNKEKESTKSNNTNGLNGHAIMNHSDEYKQIDDEKKVKSDKGMNESTNDHSCSEAKAKVNNKSQLKQEKKESNTHKEENTNKKQKNKNKEIKEKEEKENREKQIAEILREIPPKEKESPSAKEIKEHNRDREKEMQREMKCISEELRKCRTSESDLKKLLSQRKQDNTQLKLAYDDLQSKLCAVMSTRTALERRLTEERRLRAHAEQLLKAHRNNLKNGECSSEYCRARRSNADLELATLRRDIQRFKEELTQLQAQCQQPPPPRTPTEPEGSGIGPTELLELRNKAAHLERSLSAETRIKLDLFSALGESKRLLHIRDDVIRTQERKLEELKAQVAQMLAVMPPDSFTSSYNDNFHGALQCGDV